MNKEEKDKIKLANSLIKIKDSLSLILLELLKDMSLHNLKLVESMRCHNLKLVKDNNYSLQKIKLSYNKLSNKLKRFERTK